MKHTHRWAKLGHFPAPRALIGAALVALVSASAGHAQAGLDSLYQASDAESRAITAENPTGEKGHGGLATEGYGKVAARAIGAGWKVRPAITIAPGETATLADVDGPAIFRHIWMTPGLAAPATWRSMILRIYWDGEPSPSVEVPMGDFFALGLGQGTLINSMPIAVNASAGFNSYWQMPFRKHARVTMENLGAKPATLYYQADYSLEPVAPTARYFHARFRNELKTAGDKDYVILDGVKGAGEYVGTYMTYGVRHPGWWGEGEVKFYIDGDDRYPTIAGTGTEDYFGGAWSFVNDKGDAYQTYSSPYSGFPQAILAKPGSGEQSRFGVYRWHIPDPIHFKSALKVTIQMLGWKDPEPAGGPQYAPLHEHVSSVAIWYQTEPHVPFPSLPSVAELETP